MLRDYRYTKKIFYSAGELTVGSGAAFNYSTIAGEQQYTDNADEGCGISWGFPTDFYWADAITVNIYWKTTPTSGTCKWVVTYLARTTGEDLTAAGTDLAVDGTPAGTAEGLAITTTTIPAAAWTSADKLLLIKILRDGNNAGDTINSDVELMGVELEYTAWRAGDALHPATRVG